MEDEGAGIADIGWPGVEEEDSIGGGESFIVVTRE